MKHSEVPFQSSGQSPARWLVTALLACAWLPSLAQFPTVTTRTETWSGNVPRDDQDAADRAYWEQQRLQRDQQRRQLELTRQQDARIRQSQESLGERALREQAQRDGTWVPQRPGLSEQERVWRDQEQMQREQWRQQRDQTRRDDQRIRQDSESLGQRALREQAQKHRSEGLMPNNNNNGVRR